MRISIRGLTKAYGRFLALNQIDLDIAPGRLVAILGANGAGKTTLLRLLASLLSPTSGEIHFDGELFRRDRIDLRKRLHFLPDRPFVNSTLSVARHIGMGLRLYEADAPGVENRVVELMEELDLLPLAECRLGRLSRGELYKVTLVILLAVDPELWLLDEPFASGMDPRGLAVLRRHARSAVERGRTVIYSTQILEAAERFADELCIIRHGKISAYGPLQELGRNGSQDLAQIFDELEEKTF
jgi:ABC-type multidrug transport system ATPase subunit